MVPVEPACVFAGGSKREIGADSGAGFLDNSCLILTSLDRLSQSPETKKPRLRRVLLVGRAGFEPATTRLKVGCSTTELPAHEGGGAG